MKSFAVYSRQNFTSSLSLDEIADMRLVCNGIRPMFIFDITGIVYSFYRKMYTLAFLLILWFIFIIAIKYIFDISHDIIFSICLSINFTLVIFGKEIEEFFLKKRGFKVIDWETGRNLKEAAFKLQQKLSVKE